MLYRLNLKEDVYSAEHIDELIACIRSALIGYVEEVEHVGTDGTFKVVYDTDKKQKVTVAITDEHDNYGLAALEFNIYIDGEEFGPMAYNSIERAAADMKDFILSELYKKFNIFNQVNESNEDEESDAVPYTYRQVFDELKLETRNFKIAGDTIRYYYESEAKHAEKILSRHYDYVHVSPAGDWIQIEFKNTPKIKAESVLPTAAELDNSREYIGNAEVAKISDLPKVGEPFKRGIATSVNKIGYEDGYMIYEVGVTEAGSLDGFAEFDYDTSHWLYAIKSFNEDLERNLEGDEDLNEFAYKIDDLKAYYNSATGIDKDLYPNFFAWYDAMSKAGKLNSLVNAFA